MTDWPRYCGVSAGHLRWHLTQPVIFDGRNCLKELKQVRFHTFPYYGIGCGDELPSTKEPFSPQPSFGEMAPQTNAETVGVNA